MTALFLVIAAITGLVVGSFVNVVIHRVPQNKSVVDKSACPHCGNAIRPSDNVPVLSWLLLRGRCRNCHEPISLLYPTVEIVTALAFTFIVWISLSTMTWNTPQDIAALSFQLLAFLWLAAAGIALIVIDARTGKLPNAVVIPLYIAGLFLLTVSALITSDFNALLRAGISLIILALLYGVLFLFVPGGMGWGDVKLAGILGFFLGWVGWGALVVGGLAAFVMGALVGIGLLLAKRAGRGSTIAFGPWMVIGAWIGIFWGNDLWIRYLSFVDVLVGVNQKY